MTLVAEASNGREAVEMFLRHRPDVTLMDLQMPQMNRIEATIEIRWAAPAARVLVLTTYSGDIQAMRALEAGAAVGVETKRRAGVGGGERPGSSRSRR
jgi:DNA-binding NarL/FixJ family response regulator